MANDNSTPAPTVQIPRARYETLMRQALAARETIDALMSALNAEVKVTTPDPRSETPPATFGRRSA